MGGGMVRAMVGVAAVLALALTPPAAWAQAKKLVFWTHWEQNPEFNKFYETRGKDFAQKSGYEVQVVTVAAVLSILPILAVFLLGQKWVVRGVVMSGLKG